MLMKPSNEDIEQVSQATADRLLASIRNDIETMLSTATAYQLSYNDAKKVLAMVVSQLGTDGILKLRWQKIAEEDVARLFWSTDGEVLEIGFRDPTPKKQDLP